MSHSKRGRHLRAKWVPSGESIGAVLTDAAVRALEAHGGRPEIRGVPEHVETIDMTLSMFEHLQRVDFPTLHEMVRDHVPADPKAGKVDTRGIALELLVAALDFKERLAAYRNKNKSVDLDGLLWSLSHAEALRGELRAAYTTEFDRNRLQWMRAPQQAKGRQAKARATKDRNERIRAMAEEFSAEQQKSGRTPPSFAQIARHIRRRLMEASGQCPLSEKSLKDIISGRR